MFSYCKGLICIVIAFVLISCSSLEKIEVKNYCLNTRTFNLNEAVTKARINDWILKVNGEILEEWQDSSGQHIQFICGTDLDLLRYKSYFEANKKKRRIEITATTTSLNSTKTKVDIEVNVFSEKGSKEFASLGRYEKGLLNYIQFPLDSQMDIISQKSGTDKITRVDIIGNWLVMYYWESGWDGTSPILMDNYILHFTPEGTVMMDYQQCQDGVSLTSAGSFEQKGTEFVWHIKNISYAASISNGILYGTIGKEKTSPTGDKLTDKGVIFGIRL